MAQGLGCWLSREPQLRLLGTGLRQTLGKETTVGGFRKSGSTTPELKPCPKSGPEKEGGSQAGLFVQVYFKVSGTQLTDVCPSQGVKTRRGSSAPFTPAPSPNTSSWAASKTPSALCCQRHGGTGEGQPR